MKGFITVTGIESGHKFIINTNWIVSICPHEEKGYVVTTTAIAYNVTETPEEILKMIEKANKE